MNIMQKITEFIHYYAYENSPGLAFFAGMGYTEKNLTE